MFLPPFSVFSFLVLLREKKILLVVLCLVFSFRVLVLVRLAFVFGVLVFVSCSALLFLFCFSLILSRLESSDEIVSLYSFLYHFQA